MIGIIFRKRSKARIINLYNKMLFVRINGRKLARARIRFQVERRILQREEIRKKRLATDSNISQFLSANVTDLFFKCTHNIIDLTFEYYVNLRKYI